jgi:hypothetical protein
MLYPYMQAYLPHRADQGVRVFLSLLLVLTRLFMRTHLVLHCFPYHYRQIFVHLSSCNGRTNRKQNTDNKAISHRRETRQLVIYTQIYAHTAAITPSLHTRCLSRSTCGSRAASAPRSLRGRGSATREDGSTMSETCFDSVLSIFSCVIASV